MTIKEKLKKLIQEQKEQSYQNPKNVSDFEALGIMLSQYFDYDGKAIFDCSSSAFIDSNFHTFNEKFERLWDIEEASENFEAKIEAIKI